MCSEQKVFFFSRFRSMFCELFDVISLLLVSNSLCLASTSSKTFHRLYHWLQLFLRWNVAGIPLHRNSLRVPRRSLAVIHPTNNPLRMRAVSSKSGSLAGNFRQRLPVCGQIGNKIIRYPRISTETCSRIVPFRCFGSLRTAWQWNQCYLWW